MGKEGQGRKRTPARNIWVRSKEDQGTRAPVLGAK